MDWIAQHMQFCFYLFLVGIFFAIANGTGKSGNRTSEEIASHTHRSIAKPLFVLLMTGVLIVTLIQGCGGVFFDAALAAKVYEQTGDINQQLFYLEMTPARWFWVAVTVIGLFFIVIASGAPKVIAGDFDE